MQIMSCMRAETAGALNFADSGFCKRPRSAFQNWLRNSRIFTKIYRSLRSRISQLIFLDAVITVGTESRDGAGLQQLERCTSYD